MTLRSDVSLHYLLADCNDLATTAIRYIVHSYLITLFFTIINYLTHI